MQLGQAVLAGLQERENVEELFVHLEFVVGDELVRLLQVQFFREEVQNVLDELPSQIPPDLFVDVILVHRGELESVLSRTIGLDFETIDEVVGEVGDGLELGVDLLQRVLPFLAIPPLVVDLLLQFEELLFVVDLEQHQDGLFRDQKLDVQDEVAQDLILSLLLLAKLIIRVFLEHWNKQVLVHHYRLDYLV